MKNILLKIIELYQNTLSSDRGFVFVGSTSMKCRFYPSCSQYTYEAIKNYGTSRGIMMGAWRILRCNPFSEGGIDKIR